VEQLAGLADVYGSRIMGFNDLKRKAQTYLDASKDSALTEKLSAENVVLRQQVSGLQQQMVKLNERFEVLTNAEHKSNGS
jgi:cell division protein FtsB